MFEVTREFSFEAAHILPHHEGHCSRLHGHHYRVVVATRAGWADSQGMVVDFHDLDEYLQPTLEAMDHRVLLARRYLLNPSSSESLEFETKQGSRVSIPWEWAAILPILDTTAELLAEYLGSRLLSMGLAVSWVEVWETPKSCARWIP